nr:AMP-binding protein [Mycobacterium tuberculosis]
MNALAAYLAAPEPSPDSDAAVKRGARNSLDEPIAVVGMGCRFPGGISCPEALWDFLCERRSSISQVPPQRWQPFEGGPPEVAAALARTTRWGSATSGRCFSAAPNFAFELAVRRTSDQDMAGLDLRDVVGIVSGSERIHVATVRRFIERFAPYNLSPTAIRPSYGLAEATLYVAAPEAGAAPKTVRFDYEQLTAGQARPCGTDGSVGTELISYGSPDPSSVRIVNPETMVENPPGVVGEIWVHGDHVTMGYWQKPKQTAQVFDAKLVDPAPAAPEGPWLRTGDLGVISDGELFIMGRIKDLLIVDGRNHYPDDITEQLVAIIEFKRRGSTAEEVMLKLRSVKREVTSAISKSHSLRVADLVLVSPGSIPITTSGKIRRSACVERYRSDGFKRLDVAV